MAREPHAHEREDDRVDHVVRVAHEEGQLQGGPGQRVAQILERRTTEHGPALADRRPGQGHDQRFDGGEGEEEQREQRPRRRQARQEEPAADEHRQNRRWHQAASQVVEDLPSSDERQPVALVSRGRRHEREQPPQDLPVPTYPAVLPPGVCQHARGVVIDDLDIGDQCRAGVEPLEQVVRQQRVLRHAVVERGHERVHVEEPLAGVDALVEEVLIHVRDSRGIRIDPGVPGVDAREARPGRAGARDAHTRLQDAVALGDASLGPVEHGPVQRMPDDADQFLGCVPGQAGVGVEREAVAHARQHLQLADLHQERRLRVAPQQPGELLDLAALAFPAHPDPLARIPAPLAVKEEEPIGVPVAEARVEPHDAVARRVDDRVVVRQVLRVGVEEVADDREVEPGVQVAERQDLEVLDE